MGPRGGKIGERIIKTPVVAFLVWVLWPVDAVAQGHDVDLELVLAVDCSYSVDAGEFRLQMDGIAAAFRAPQLHAALAIAAPNGIAVSLMQWSGGGNHIPAVDWHLVADPASAAAFAAQVARTERLVPPGSTGLGAAMFASLTLLQNNGFSGSRQVIDISGDGPNNAGAEPDLVRDMAVDAGVVINGLPILNEVGYLDHYYRNHVIGGLSSFILPIAGYEDYASAILLKLIREIGADQFATLRPEGLD